MPLVRCPRKYEALRVEEVRVAGDGCGIDVDTQPIGAAREHFFAVPGSPWEAAAHCSAARGGAAGTAAARAAAAAAPWRNAAAVLSAGVADTGCAGALPVVTDLTVTVTYAGMLQYDGDALVVTFRLPRAGVSLLEW